MYSEMHIWRYNIKNYYMKHSQNWGVHRFQIDGQAFTSSYRVDIGLSTEQLQFVLKIVKLLNIEMYQIIS